MSGSMWLIVDILRVFLVTEVDALRVDIVILFPSMSFQDVTGL